MKTPRSQRCQLLRHLKLKLSISRLSAFSSLDLARAMVSSRLRRRRDSKMQIRPSHRFGTLRPSSDCVTSTYLPSDLLLEPLRNEPRLTSATPRANIAEGSCFLSFLIMSRTESTQPYFFVALPGPLRYQMPALRYVCIGGPICKRAAKT